VREVLVPRGSYLVAVTVVSILIVLVLPLAAYAQEDLPPGIGDPPKGEPSKGVRTKEGPPNGARTKEGPPRRESPGDDKELLEAGGDLPLPQRSEAGDVPANGGGFSLWRVSGMILSGSVFVFAVYRLFLGPQ